MEEKIKKVLTEIKLFYAKNADRHLTNKFRKAKPEEIENFENDIDEKLPESYKFFLMYNDFQIDFHANYASLDLDGVVRTRSRMCKLLEEGVFDDGRVERNQQTNIGNWDGDFLKVAWWNIKWIPVSEDSCGNMICIDLDPGSNGKHGQIITMDIQDRIGPFREKTWQSFENYLEKHLEYLKNGQYFTSKNSKGEVLIEIDRFEKTNK